MLYLGDFAAGATVRGMWNSNAIAGESITRGTNGSILIYKDNSTTERSSAAGITDTEDFDSKTGVHHYNIDLSDNTDAGFYAAAHDYFVVLSAATIDGKTINAVLGCFSIENRNIKVNVTQFGGTNLTVAAGIPEVKVASIAANAITAASIATDAITDAKVASDVTIASVTGAVGSVTGNVGGNVVGSVASVTADSVHTGTAQAGGASSITLASGASSTNNVYNYQRVDITSGTGAGQSAIIIDYVGSTKVATVDYAWNVTPDNTSVYRVAYSRVPRSVSKVTGDVEGKILGTTSGGGTMSGAGVWAYDHTGAAITSGSGLDAAGVRAAVGLASANLDTQLSTIDDFLDTEVAAIKAKTDLIPASPAAVGSAMTLADGAITTAKFASGAIDAAAIATDAFGALELAAGAASEIAAAVVDQTLSGHTTAGTVGGALNSAGASSLGSAGADPLTTPAATATYGAKIDWIHAMLSNEQTQTKTLQTVAKADGTVISEAPVTSDGTTVTREKFANP